MIGSHHTRSLASVVIGWAIAIGLLTLAIEALVATVSAILPLAAPIAIAVLTAWAISTYRNRTGW
ncbi:MAG: hypothetical protein AAF567_06895 [Actinomycetota bacterium]